MAERGPITQELEQTLMQLPLGDRQFLLTRLEHSISDEFDRMAAASVANDLRMVELHLAEPSLTDEQYRELNARVAAAERGDAEYVPWSQVQRRVLARLRRAE